MSSPRLVTHFPRSEIAYLKAVASVFQLVPAAAVGAYVAWLLNVSYPAKRFVYIIRSVNDPGRRYIGVTADVAARFEKYLKSGAGHAFASRHFVDES
jgi:hypothetical protein